RQGIPEEPGPFARDRGARPAGDRTDARAGGIALGLAVSLQSFGETLVHGRTSVSHVRGSGAAEVSPARSGRRRRRPRRGRSFRAGGSGATARGPRTARRGRRW